MNMDYKMIRLMMALMVMTLVCMQTWADTNPSKEAKKQAKTMKKEGWQVADGEKSLEMQLTECQLCMTDSNYIVESATFRAANYHLGYNTAHAKALRAIASRLNTFITSDTEMIQFNQQQADGTPQSGIGINRQTKSISEETLSNAFPVLVISRKMPDGTYEVQVHLAIALKQLSSN